LGRKGPFRLVVQTLGHGRTRMSCWAHRPRATPSSAAGLAGESAPRE
jgi:hypothetical protein